MGVAQTCAIEPCGSESSDDRRRGSSKAAHSAPRSHTAPSQTRPSRLAAGGCTVGTTHPGRGSRKHRHPSALEQTSSRAKRLRMPSSRAKRSFSFRWSPRSLRCTSERSKMRCSDSCRCQRPSLTRLDMKPRRPRKPKAVASYATQAALRAIQRVSACFSPCETLEIHSYRHKSVADLSG